MVNRCFLVDPEHLFGSAKFRGYHTNWVGCESFKFGGGGCPFREVANCFQIVTIHSNRSDHLLLFLYERVSINYLY